MFFTYLRRELRRRMRQAIFISLGLALGIGLVITVTAASNGVKNSQASVLHALYGVGTDLTVTQAPPQGSGGQKTSFGFQQQIKAAKQGQIAAGTKININDLVNGRYAPLRSGALAAVARQHGVTSAVGGLTLSDVTVTGTVPAVTTGGTGSGGGSFRSAFTTNSFSVAGVDVNHTALGPLSAAKLTSGAGLTSADANFAHAVVDSGYATQNKLGVGSVIDVGGTNFTITGIVSAPQGGSPPDVYIPLAKAQSLGKNGTSSLTGQVNTIYVSAASAADISLVQGEIAAALPSATVTDQNDLASEVTGSLSSASGLANDLGKWLSAAVLIAAFLLASLLTMAAVTRRVREFGTLKALGWRSRRIIGQVMGESITIGIVGGIAGVGLGYAGAALIGTLAPKLTATVGSANSASAAGTGKGGGGTLRALTNTPHTVSVTLTAPVTVTVIVAAVVLAVAGGLIAGSFGGWRAARLRPAAALARVE
jgi:ABC-type antimicrobial peptide transport system permease subunit